MDEVPTLPEETQPAEISQTASHHSADQPAAPEEEKPDSPVEENPDFPFEEKPVEPSQEEEVFNHPKKTEDMLEA